ncbi:MULTISPECIES: fimbrial protein [unclassified Serratia (in: enterobacteria)]|uniref:fimbrial protein n=1 Tax=unclassified Serratia (in: enterobacteria) TaxID=2647522 RepID=UPI002ED3A263|nr:fimbrial protein [Serratia sp. C2(2)]MEE4449987.1 fimbrial protein [Serratia sp. C2(1)]
MGTITSSFAASDALGRVNMKGAIVETPCAIEVGDRDQTLIMGNVPISQILRDGRGPEKAFSIRLFDCVLTSINPQHPGWKRFQVTFDGDADNDYFKTRGEANGVAMMIRDRQGNIATPGAALPAGNITPGDMHLRYTLNLVGNKENLRAGDFRSTIRFRMDYN